MYHVAFIGQYLNAPAGNECVDNRFLMDIIRFIGKKYGSGKGSNFAKGKRYIKSKVSGCCSRHIKLMLRSVPNVIIRDSNDDKYVFRFSINSYIHVFEHIIEIMQDNHDSLSNDIAYALSIIQREVINPKMTYSELLINEPLISLETVCHHGKTKEIRQKAFEIIDGIKRIDKKYDI